MKYITFLIVLLIAIYFIPQQPKGNFFGQAFDYGNAKNIVEVVSEKIDTVGKFVVVSGVVESVCQEKGCWVKVKTTDGAVRSTFKNYGFFVPKDIAGKEIILSGIIKEKTIPAAMEQHFNEDAGDTTHVMPTAPVTQKVFVASGVFLKN